MAAFFILVILSFKISASPNELRLGNTLKQKGSYLTDTSDNGLLITGTHAITNGAQEYTLITKLNSDNQVLWTYLAGHDIAATYTKTIETEDGNFIALDRAISEAVIYIEIA